MKASSFVLESQRVVLDEADSLVIRPAEIHIDNGFITKVEPLSEPSLPKAEHRIDLGNQLISPAFINSHTHLSMGMFRGLSQPVQLQTNVVESLYFQVEQHLVEADIRAFTRMGAYESLLAGVGCVWDHYYGKQAVVDALRDVGLCAVFAPTLQDQGGPAAGRADDVLDFTIALHRDSAAQKDGIVAALGPHASDTVSVDLWKRIAELSDTHQLPVHAHIAQSVEELNRSHHQLNCSPIGKLEQTGVLDAAPAMLLVHGLFVTHQDLKRLHPSRHVLGYCPFSQLQFDYPAQLESWRRAGLSFALGTDCGGCNDSMSVQQEMRLVAGGHAFETTWGAEHDHFRVTGGPDAAIAVAEARRRRFQRNIDLNDPTTLLRSVWQVPGHLHPAMPLGRIAAGYRANLVVWDMNHPAFWPGTDPLRVLTFGDVGSAIYGLMVNGQFVSQLGEHSQSILASPAFQAARQEASERLASLLKQIRVT